MSLEERIWAKVHKTESCWLWTGARNSKGYGQLFKEKIAGKSFKYAAHRLVYELLVGPIPEGLTIDHLCRNPPCVNPAHLEPVTMKINHLRGTSPMAANARKTHCSQGHPFSGDNLVVTKRGRQCRECNRRWNGINSHARYLEQKERGLRDKYWTTRKTKIALNSNQ